MGNLRANAEYLKFTYDFLDIPNNMYQGSLTTEKRSDRKYEIEFRDVSFKYPGTDTWALRHVSMKGPRAHLAMEEAGPKELSPCISAFAAFSRNRSWA